MIAGVTHRGGSAAALNTGVGCACVLWLRPCFLYRRPPVRQTPWWGWESHIREPATIAGAARGKWPGRYPANDAESTRYGLF